ncbi:MAG: metallophosphoesterase [Mailhella sp.]|nr:metallophosphoesterase [Mailhella sp.]
MSAMRYAILSDIHANAAALRAALVDAQDMHADRIVCLGDVLGYGPEPVAALETVYARAHVCLAGNHDDAVCGRCSTDDFNDLAAKAVERQRRLLTADARAWLAQLPYRRRGLPWAGAAPRRGCPRAKTRTAASARVLRFASVRARRTIQGKVPCGRVLGRCPGWMCRRPPGTEDREGRPHPQRARARRQLPAPPIFPAGRRKEVRQGNLPGKRDWQRTQKQIGSSGLDAIC